MDFRREILLAERPIPEQRTCQYLESIGLYFIPQYHIFTGRKHFYADIYIPEYFLIVEIDGGYHFTPEQRRLDRLRTAALKRLGYKVCRIKNKETKSVATIRRKLARHIDWLLR
jgi:very-short-patch-repair endonuclease